MIKKGIWVIVIVVVVLGLLLAGFGCTTEPTSPTATSPTPTSTSPTPTKTTPGPSPTAPEVIKWVGQNEYAVTEPSLPGLTMKGGMGQYSELFGAFIERNSQGRLVLDIAPPGSILPTSEMFNAVASGAVDFNATSYCVYYTGTIPEAHIEAGLFGGWPLTAQEMHDFIYNRRAGDILQEAYNEAGVWGQWWPCPPVYAIHSTVPIRNVEEMAGIKIRAGGVVADAMRTFGAIPTPIPSAEGYMALKLGTIDAAYWSAGQQAQIKLREVCKYLVMSPMSCGALLSAVVNLDQYNALDDDLKQVMDDALYATLEMSLIDSMDGPYQAAISERDWGVELISWPDSDLDKMMAANMPIINEYGERNARCRKLADILLEQLMDLGRITPEMAATAGYSK